ncbi:transposase family protein [Caloramator sp. mosi_1]|nr:transposase family protein [Caloramator sp. mosi_1]WDC85536.1 transposase family protein [Caloramator sp. mosi_1]WDC85537.1 transposase family protein [Caloramator sp. mosi_1]WDC85552.1 transposase family protein [Caloramator sp. mosi_1]WDC85645.1 transposase family protein [Caloramator sp. mosi_1]WDC85646.1 transposase family protein [Caloramator sp. mosi_1]
MKDIPLFFKHTFIILKKRRYRCNACGKNFMNI